MPSSETFTACASKVGPSAPPTSTNASKALRVAPGALRSSVLISSSVVSASAIENRSQEGQVFMSHQPLKDAAVRSISEAGHHVPHQVQHRAPKPIEHLTANVDYSSSHRQA